MPPTTSYRQGDINLVSFPFTDLTSLKRRPAIVVSPDTFNELGEDVVLVAVTSQLMHAFGTVALLRTDVTDRVLPKDSIIRLAKLFTLHSSLVVKRLCRLKTEKRHEVLGALRSFFA